MTEDQNETNSTDYLQKFSYRSYEGKIDPRWKRVLNLMVFEFISTWRKSIFAKILIIIIFSIYLFALISIALRADFFKQTGLTENIFRDGLNSNIAGYLGMSYGLVVLSTPEGYTSPSELNIRIGLILIIIFGLAGSGYFADDKYGKLIEIYLSRFQKKEYLIGKFGAIVLYINIFIMIPQLIVTIYFVDVMDYNHLHFVDLYLRIILYSLICSIILGLFILNLSIFVERRSYASLIFILFYLFGSIIGSIIASNNLEDEELFLLIAPSIFFALLAYVCLGVYEVGIFDEVNYRVYPLYLNDGVGLEYWHVLLQTFLIIFFLVVILVYKLQKLSTEEL